MCSVELGASIHRRPRRGQPVDRARGVDFERDPEVGQVRVVALVDQDVAGLDIAMDYACVMGCAEGRSDLVDKLRHARERPRLLARFGCHRSTAHPAHHQVRTTRLPPVVVERNDVRMLESRDQLRLVLEATNEIGIVSELGPDDLDRDLAANGRLRCAEDCTERAFADLLTKLVAAQRVAPGRRVHAWVARENERLELVQLR